MQSLKYWPATAEELSLTAEKYYPGMRLLNDTLNTATHYWGVIKLLEGSWETLLAIEKI